MQITKISVVSHLRMLLLIFDTVRIHLAQLYNPDTIFDCFIEPERGSLCITKLFVIHPSITSNIQIQSTRYRTKHWRMVARYKTRNEVKTCYEQNRET